MTDMYNDPKRFEGKLNPYPHEELGVEVRKRLMQRSAIGTFGFKQGSTRSHGLFYVFLLYAQNSQEGTRQRSCKILAVSRTACSRTSGRLRNGPLATTTRY